MNPEATLAVPGDLTASAAGERRRLWRLALRQRSVWRRAVQLGLTVGFLQMLLNQGDHWFKGEVDQRVVLKSIASPLIGFTLVLFSAAQTWVQRTVETLAHTPP